jgi:hypothetical protein
MRVRGRFKLHLINIALYQLIFSILLKNEVELNGFIVIKRLNFEAKLFIYPDTRNFNQVKMR